MKCMLDEKKVISRRASKKIQAFCDNLCCFCATVVVIISARK